MMMIMDMYMYWGTDVVFLLKSWTITNNVGLYLVAVAASYILAILVEFLSTRKIQNDFQFAGVYAVQLLIAYTLMLILMTFNGGLFLTIVLGYTTGYFLFGFDKLQFKQKGVYE